MKKAKENWIGEQCSETEENLRKNNSKRAYQRVKDLTTVKQEKAQLNCPRQTQRTTTLSFVKKWRLQYNY